MRMTRHFQTYDGGTFYVAAEVQSALKKLSALEDAEEQGRLVILPCKMGDTVYYLTGNPTLASGYHFNRVESTKCIGFYSDREGLQICLYMPHGNHGTYGRYGKTIFLAREEAEAALQGKQYE